ncbi:SDR family oxidoreductase [Aestuariivirga sp.]|uniref:SDR family oxidoreductase n=1 Tax=Aestuariivirga sp. TaxID=2650926 RepID=UPI003BAD64D8
MDLDLKNKTALVCGASQGLGAAIAEALAREGCKVGLLARNADKLNRLVTDWGAQGMNAMALPANMGDWSQIEAAVSAFGMPDILINNSGGPPPVDVTKVEPDLWRRQFEIMVLNQMRLTELVLPHMRAQGFGRILSVASTSIVEPFASLAISNSLRAALAGWMKTLAGQVAPDGVTVNMLLPGSFATERIDKLNAAEAEARGVPVSQIVSDSSGDIPVGRYGEPAEFAAVAAFLASPKASYVTGQMIRIDGGVTKSL